MKSERKAIRQKFISEGRVRPTFDLASTRLFVQALWVASFYNGQWGINEHFNKAESSSFVQLARDGAVSAVRRDECSDCDAGGVSEQFGDLHSIVSVSDSSFEVNNSGEPLRCGECSQLATSHRSRDPCSIQIECCRRPNDS